MTSNLVTMTSNLVTMTRRPPLSSLCILLLYLLSQQPIGGVQNLDGGRLEPVPFDRDQPQPFQLHQAAPFRAGGHAHILQWRVGEAEGVIGVPVVQPQQRNGEAEGRVTGVPQPL